MSNTELSREEINEILKVNLEADTNMASNSGDGSATDFDLGRQESSFRFFNHYFNDSSDSFDAGIGGVIDENRLAIDVCRRSSKACNGVTVNDNSGHHTQIQVDEHDSAHSRRSSSTSVEASEIIGPRLTQSEIGVVATITDFSPDWSYPEVQKLASGSFMKILY